MDEHFEWTAGRKSCWGLTARVLFGFGLCLTVAWLAGVVGMTNEVVAAVQ